MGQNGTKLDADIDVCRSAIQDMSPRLLGKGGNAKDANLIQKHNIESWLKGRKDEQSMRGSLKRFQASKCCEDHLNCRCPKEPAILNLSVDQKKLLLRTWRDDFDSLYNLGAQIYREIFTREPEVEKLFPEMTQRRKPDDAVENGGGEIKEWKESKEFRSQALKFVQVLTLTIKGLNNPTTSIDPMLFRVGALHIKFIPRGFKPAYWNVFQEAMEAAITEQIRTTDDAEMDAAAKEEVLQAWAILAKYIILRMSEGFHNALQESKANIKGILADSWTKN